MSASVRTDLRRNALRRLPASERYLHYLPAERADDECWPWQGPMSSTGYGTIREGGRKMQAHRFVYETLVGPIPDGLHIDHLCANRRCVNPAHLEPVTQAENNRRASPRLKRATCKRGHALTPENSFVYRNGRSECRTCRTERRRRHYIETGA